MTYLEAAYTVLYGATEPLHYAEITRRALEQGLIAPSGLTPDATMGSRLYTDTQEEGTRFVRAGKGLFALASPKRSDIEEQIQVINQHTREKLGQLLHSMPAKRFEELVMQLLLKMGFDESTLEVTPHQGDGGIDVVGVYRAAGLTEVNVAVQAKRWKSNVQAPTVTSLRGSLQVHQQGIVITTSGFSQGARREAIALNKTHITLIDGKQLIDMLVHHLVGVVKRPLVVNALDEEWWGELLTVEIPSAGQSSPEAAAPTNVTADKTASPSAAVAPQSYKAKPASITLFGEQYAVESWKELLMTVCTVLSTRHTQQFAAFAPTLRGRTRHYVALSPEDIHSPVQIAKTELFVETNLSARSIVQLVHKLLDGLGYQANSLIVHLRQS